MKKTLIAGISGFTVMIAFLANAQIISFEPDANGCLPDGSLAIDNMAISNQFLRYGVSFGIDSDLDGTPDPNKYPFLEEIGYDGIDGFMTSTPGARDIAEGETTDQLGRFFLRTSAVNPTNIPENLLVSYIEPVTQVSAELWDIDANDVDYEQWRIEVLGANGQIITNLTSPVGIHYNDPDSLDGRPWPFEITTDSIDKISALRFMPCGNRPQYVGLAFNNFSPAQCLGTTNVIGVAKVHPSVEISWHSQLGRTYQLQWSGGLGDQWHNLNAPVQGTGVEITVFDSTRRAGNRIYRVIETY